MRRGVGWNASVGGRAQVARDMPVRGEVFTRNSARQAEIAQDRAMLARFFVDLRRALRLTLPQAADYLRVSSDVIEALETGDVEFLPPWPDTARLILAYASMANIDGRPVLTALGHLISLLPTELPEVPETRSGRARGHVAHATRPLGRARSAIASGARNLPKDAIHQIRERPKRALYALSVPLLLVLLFQGISFSMIAQPFEAAVRHASVYFQEHFAPTREGFRWIETEDPRSRRADKLQIAGSSG